MAGADRDAEVLRAVFANEADGWTRLLQGHAPAVRAVIRQVSERYGEPVGAEDVDEVTLEVFERVAADRFQWLKALRSADMLGPSLRALAAWRALGLLRAKYRAFTCSLESEVKLGKSHVATAVLARPPGKERAPFLTREEVDRLAGEFLEARPGRRSRILEEIYSRSRSYAEIAEKEGMPVPSVAQAVYEERRSLGERLAKAAPEARL
jgi:DNA-directed RNA polymerase specialized sigma24 family protein